MSRTAKIKTFFFAVLLATFLFPAVVFGHQIVTSVYINLGVDGNEKALPENKVFSYINISAYNIALLVSPGKDPAKIFPELPAYKKIFTDYIAEHISFINNGKECNFETKQINPRNDAEFYVNGIGFNLDISCPDPIKNLYVRNNIMLSQNSYQVCELDVLISDDNTLATTFSAVENTVRIIKKDGKYYFEKNISSVPPLSDASAWEADFNNFSAGQDAPEKTQSFIDKVFAEYQKFKTGSWGGNFVNSVAGMLNGLSPSSIAGILLIVTFIGGLHSLEGGHNKVILASLMINNKIDFKGSFFYVLIFTITHMSDIIILSVGLLFFNSYFNIYEKIPAMRTYSSWALLIISSYIVVKETMILLVARKGAAKSGGKNTVAMENLQGLFKTDNYADKKESAVQQETNILMQGTFKEQLMIAFISGLAPCLTGWIIFMLIVSSGNIWLLLPALGAFGLGVFLVLLLFAYLFSLFRDQMESRFNWIAKYAPLISGMFLLLFSLLQL